MKHVYKKGFTLIEVLLYTTIAATLVFVVVLFTGTFIEARIKNRTIYEVASQGQFIMNEIIQTVQESSVIVAPLPGSAGGTLHLDRADASLSPAVFEVVGGVIQIKEGLGSSVPLSNSHVEISDLVFENRSLPDTPGILHISFSISYKNTAGRYEYNFSKTFQGGVALRDN